MNEGGSIRIGNYGFSQIITDTFLCFFTIVRLFTVFLCQSTISFFIVYVLRYYFNMLVFHTLP